VTEGKYIAIGDIHGCLQTLNELLIKLIDYSDYTYIFIGDYIDRGPNSYGVVERLIEFAKGHSCIFLRGNHEHMLLDAYSGGDLDLWLRNGGKATLASYGAAKDHIYFPDEHVDFYQKTKMYFETENYFFVHAGLSPFKTIKENLQDEAGREEFLWRRSHLNAFETVWEKEVIFGHTPRPHPILKPNMIGIDTGCVYTSLGYGKLTAVMLPDQEFIQQICVDKL
jgi:serine/threonine protein phosphatase 1